MSIVVQKFGGTSVADAEKIAIVLSVLSIGVWLTKVAMQYFAA